MKRLLFSVSLLLGGFYAAQAQNVDSLLAAEEGPQETEYATATFKGTRLINFHTVENPGPRTLDFRISHRFGDISTGAYNFWGLDGPASIRIGFEYSYDGRLAVGVGRTSYQKMYDGFLKYKLLRQTLHSNKMPVTVTLLSGTNWITLKDKETYSHWYHRMQYQHQIMIARKFNDAFSFQLSPTYIHYNIVEKSGHNNDAFALIGMGRWKFSRSTALTAEYGYRLNPWPNATDAKRYKNSVGVGFDIETGGHVFQVFVTNSLGIMESQAINQTLGDPLKGNLKLGFNVSRVFRL